MHDAVVHDFEIFLAALFISVAGLNVLARWMSVPYRIAIGLVVGFVVGEIRRRLNDAPTEITISLFTAYAAFIPADELGLSGVLAAVTTGLYLGWQAPRIASAQMRLQGFAVWEILVFLLNATLFILIGLQLPIVVDGIQGLSAAEVGW